MTTQTIAKEILNQLGGNKFLVMTGAHNLISSNNALSMHLRRNKVGAKYLKITLNEMDTYNLSFTKLSKSQLVTVKEFKGIYSDQLQSIFTKVTGYCTSL